MARSAAARRSLTAWAAAATLCAVVAVTGVRAQPQSNAVPARAGSGAAACAVCHGSPESAPLAGMPTLAGQQEEFLVLQLILLREGLRDVPQMTGMLNGFSDRELGELAQYFARQPLSRHDASRDAGLHGRGASLARSLGCGSCHLADFSGQRQVPRLRGQREDYLLEAMKAYRDNRRTGVDTSMNAVLYQVSDTDLRALAHYLAHE